MFVMLSFEDENDIKIISDKEGFDHPFRLMTKGITLHLTEKELDTIISKGLSAQQELDLARRDNVA